MQIKVNFSNHNIIPDAHAKLAHEDDCILGNPIKSFPFELENIPASTKTLAWTLIDYDAVPVCGFPWIHWSVANVPTTGNSLAISSGFSRNKDYQQIRGKNSFVTGLLADDFSSIENHYVGPTPPDQDHIYTLTVYALDSQLDLSEGFYLNELLKKMDGHVLEKTQIKLVGKY